MAVRATGFYRTTVSDAKLGGVCGGIARQYHVDSTLVRVIYVLATLLLFGVGVILYLVLWVTMPEEEGVTGKRKREPGPGPVYR